MTNRCEKHKIFIGKDGCKICNQIEDAKKSDYRTLLVEEMKANAHLKQELEQLKSNAVPELVKFAAKYLTRNEMFLVRNLLGGQAILAAIVDKIVATPDNKKQVLKPLFDYTMSICDKIDILNDELAPTAIKVLGAKKYEDNLLDVASICNFLGGKITKCLTCTAWLDDKAKNRKIMRDEINNK